MNKKTKGWYAIAIILCSALLLLWWKMHDIKGMRGILKDNEANTVEAEMWPNNEEVDLVSEEFLKSIRNNNYDEFKSIVSPSGLAVIKNYTYSNGVRGRDLRGYYGVKEIPKDICFSVMNGFNISLKELFKGALDVDISTVKHMNMDKIAFNFTTAKDSGKTLPSTEEIWAICESIRAAGSSEVCPQIYNLSDKEFVLTSSDYNTCRGAWAVFEKINNKYYLRAVLDFR